MLHTSVGRDSHTLTHTGRWAWLLQRVSGVLLVAYLFLHIAVISTSRSGEEGFDSALRVVQHPVLAALDIVLIAIVLYHAFNGVRVILFDLGIGIGQQAALFWASVTLTVAGTAIAAYLSIPLIVR